MRRKRRHLFHGIGVEIEYMAVNRDSLDVLPRVDDLIKMAAGDYISEFERGRLRWSNELVTHVIELKTNGPETSLPELGCALQSDIIYINELLRTMDGMLLPSGMHPWMNPEKETRIWPHEYSAVYEAYDRIFSCRGHGWSNLQSIHLNLPFCGNREFAALHAAIRLALPVLPALSASSPVMEGRITGLADSRLEAYRVNQKKIPSLAGDVVPESVHSRARYRKMILAPMYHDIRPYDRDRILKHEWLNSRGAIARFDRGSIEIRVLDTTECVASDLAVSSAVTALLKMMVYEEWSARKGQQDFPQPFLVDLFSRVIRDGEKAVIDHPAYLSHFGFHKQSRCTAGELWRHLYEAGIGDRMPEGLRYAMEWILDKGTLSRRILNCLGKTPSKEDLMGCYRRLADCLARGEMFGS